MPVVKIPPDKYHFHLLSAQSFARVFTKYPTASEPDIVNSVSRATYIQPKYEIITGIRNGLTARLPKKQQ
jgi:hypothetical protein